MYSRSAKGGEKGDPNRNPWLAKMLIIMLVKYVLSDGISQAFLPFRFVDVIVIRDHDLFWNVGQEANCILKYLKI